MFVKELELGLDYEKAGLTAPGKVVSFTGYILENSAEYCRDRKRPAVLICPGGGYAFTSDREATPIAMSFLAAGISAFVLRYSCAPDGVRFPTQLCEAAAAMKVIRSHAAEWNLDEKRIAVCGFSAGGHLAASLGVFWNSDLLKDRGLGGESCRPDAMVLSYPVITSGPKAHRGSFENLLGDQANDETMLTLTSLEKQVTADTPPAFLWHTRTDATVPVMNSLLYVQALTEHNVPFAMHIYPTGYHGLSTADEQTNDSLEPAAAHAHDWLDALMKWLKITL